MQDNDKNNISEKHEYKTIKKIIWFILLVLIIGFIFFMQSDWIYGRVIVEKIQVYGGLSLLVGLFIYAIIEIIRGLFTGKIYKDQKIKSFFEKRKKVYNGIVLYFIIPFSLVMFVLWILAEI